MFGQHPACLVILWCTIFCHIDSLREANLLFKIYREREELQNAKAVPATFRSTLQKPKQRTEGIEPDLERAIYGSWKRGKGLKKDGLMKKVRTPQYMFSVLILFYFI